MHECQMYEMNSFVTLTYDEDHVPLDGSLNHKHFRLFMKRVRRAFGPTRFFMSGEYGGQFGRPHYHACLFGVYFEDRKLLSTSGAGSDLYSSETLSSLWERGYASVGDVTFSSAAYVARYVVKKVGEKHIRVDGDGAVLEPEYGQMSRRPGIGYTWWQKYGQEVLNRGNVVMDGIEMKVPRYYGKLCSDPAFDWVEQQGIGKHKSEDQTDDRLYAREVVAEARLKLKKRGLEL